ncbi:MAG: hypothetical protein OEV08_16390, partial [Nitrospira sp.]|nr:hypothetical protein [Nitrospira sp.]
RWAKAFQCKVTIHTSLEQNPWADPQQQSDIAGWHVSTSGNTIEWMADVETADSMSDAETLPKWKQAKLPGIPFYLFVPRGLKESAQKLAEASAVHFSGIYEYTFENGCCQVL